MATNSGRRLVDRITSNPSFLGVGVTMAGTVACDGDMIIAGSIRGESKVRGAITLLEGSRWEGNIAAANAVIGGQVQGDVVITERLEIRKSARIHGSVHARIIAVAEGAVINGEIGTSAEVSVIRFQEKRKQS
jgi:cytoskeletal protein CcmA (bactofilin family)